MPEDEIDRSSSRTPDERQRLAAIRSADSLASLAAVMGTATEHAAYREAKTVWRELRTKELGAPQPTAELPGDTVEIDRQSFIVHGITHRDTDPERSVLHAHVTKWLEAGAAVYCEEGIRPMYFGDFPGVYEMDDYRWAMFHCRNKDIESHIDDVIESTFDEGVTPDIKEVAARFRGIAFSLIASGAEVYGDQIATALGDVASGFFMGHKETATVPDFTSFQLSRRAATDPTQLAHLQYYYKCVLLPQPLEREWLRRHDRELELFTHARNERLAAYARFHGPATGPVHLLVGAAHQPGVTYYLEAIRNNWTPTDFEPIP